jgi:hypothetical protein
MKSFARAFRLRATIVSVCALTALPGCSSDIAGPPVQTPAAGPRLAAIVAGDQQTGARGAPLSVTLALEALDSLGAPRSHVAISWIADDDGWIAPHSATTDDAGRAESRWTLGPEAGIQHAHAVVDGVVVADFSATASAQHATPLTSPRPLLLQTSDGSAQTVHPDFVTMPDGWDGGGQTQYLVLTPYPNGNSVWENPSLYTGTDAVRWDPPSGVTNPLATPAPNAYLSDPDAVAVPERDELWVYYREVTASNSIFLIRSGDGVHFSPPTLVAQARSDDIVSPTIVRRGPTDWRMWSENSNMGCAAATTSVELRTSTNGIDWSAPQTVKLDQPGFSPWHIDVEWIPSRHEFWAVYNGKTAGTCSTGALFLATSTDGITWRTYPSPILSRGVIPEFANIVYRSTFTYDPATDAIDFWYSGARFDGRDYVWSSAYQRRTRPEVFATAATPLATATLDLRPARSNAPPLLDAP